MIVQIPTENSIGKYKNFGSDKIEVWYKGFLYGEKYLVRWEDFTKALCMWFGNMKDVVEKFNKLVQEKEVEEYVDRFDELKSLMCALNPFILEVYYISSFLSGLKEYIRPILKILKPATPMQDFD